MSITKRLLSLFLAVTATVQFTVYGFTDVVISGGEIRARAVASFVGFKPYIDHYPITNVLPDNGYLRAKVIPHCGLSSAKITDIEFKYKFNQDDPWIEDEFLIDDKVPTSEEFKKIENEKPFYLKTTASFDGKEKIIYSIYVKFDKYESEPKTKTEEISAKISNSAEKKINGEDGGEIILQNGDQTKSDTIITIPEGSYNGEHTVTIDFGYNSGSNVLKAPAYNETSSRKDVCIADWSISPELADVELLIPLKITNGYLEYTRPETAKKDVLQYKRDESDTWHNVEKNGNLLIDIENKMFSCEMPKFGYYRIISMLIMEDNDYRPKRRALIKNRMNGPENMFVFNGLQEGDVVKIFNINGKKIRELKQYEHGYTDGFVWDGRTDSGEWAKSGIYIYQIKVEGKLISGTIVFAK